MYYLKVLDWRTAHGSDFGAVQDDWVTHGPFKSADEATRWWQKCCDDIRSEAEAYYGGKCPDVNYVQRTTETTIIATFMSGEPRFHIDGVIFYAEGKKDYYSDMLQTARECDI